MLFILFTWCAKKSLSNFNALSGSENYGAVKYGESFIFIARVVKGLRASYGLPGAGVQKFEVFGHFSIRFSIKVSKMYIYDLLPVRKHFFVKLHHGKFFV